MINRLLVALGALALVVAAVAGGFLLFGGDDSETTTGPSGSIDRPELEQIAPDTFRDWGLVPQSTGYRALDASWPGDLYAPERQQLSGNGHVIDYLVTFRAPDRRGELLANLSLFVDEEGARRSEPIGVVNVTEQLGRETQEEPALGAGARRIEVRNRQARLYGYFWRVENLVISVTAIGRNLERDVVFEAANTINAQAKKRAEE